MPERERQRIIQYMLILLYKIVTMTTAKTNKIICTEIGPVILEFYQMSI